MPSFEEINYSLRPNKSIERKMIIETIQKLSYLDDLRNYRYIGFGSTYFTDFILFHKYFGLDKMISIESEDEKKLRFEFNKPFSCIKMEYGRASDVLPNLDLSEYLNIIWLDYDGKIEDYIFSDINTVVSNSKSGSMFLISINVEPDDGEKKERMQKLIDRVGKLRIPVEYTDILLSGNIYPLVAYEMIDRQIKKTLLERNGADDSKLDYLQLFHYLYKDGAQMLTVGGILLDNKQKKLLKKMKFEELPHLSNNGQSYKIKCPNLTYKEVHHLNNLLPCRIDISTSGNIKNKEFKKIPLKPNDIKNFAEIYRYYPNFVETNM